METMTKREKRKEAARQSILDTAEVIFGSHGFAATTMDMIAEASDWSKGALYTHFTSKEELFFTLVLQKYALYESQMTHAIESALSVEALLRALVGAEIEFFADHRDFFQILVNEQSILASATDENLMDQHGAFLSRQSDRLRQKLSEIGAGKLPMPADMLALSITGAINSNLVASFGDTPEEVEALRESLIKLFLHGLMNPWN